VPRSRAEAGCHELAFQTAYPVDESGEVALEDYARAVCRAGAAELLRNTDQASAVAGVHLCAVDGPLTPAVLADIEDFARSLAVGGAGPRRWP
jgi:hypothetical protein